MNTETAKRRAIVEILNAASDGKSIRYARCQSVDVFDPNYRNILFQYPQNFCIAPEPKTRPWSKPEDVPGPVCYLRSKGFSEGWSLITGARADESGSMDGVLLVGFRTGSRFVAWSELSEFEYSTDRKNWSPCVVTEEAQ